jgi:FKBP-type peptidyl-prolyl cis-trans isomerase SlyD
VEFLVGGGDLLAKIEEGLRGREPGDKVELHLEPEQAFGDFDDRLLFLEPLSRFPEGLEIGMAFEGLPEGCNPEAPADRLYFVSEIYPEHVVMDGNHPLAGIALRLLLRIHLVREATEDEIGRGTLGSGFFQVQPGTPPGATLH